MSVKNLLDQSNLKMSHKGALLVSIPLMLGTIFVIVLALLLFQTEQQVQRETRARTIILTADELATHYVESIFTVSAYLMTKSESLGERYDQMVGKFPVLLQKLTDAVSNDPEKLKTVNRMKVVAERASTFLTLMRNSTDTVYNPRHVIYLSGMRSHVTAVFREFNSEYHNLVAAVESEQRANPISSANTRLYLQQALAVGMILNMIMSVLLARFFSHAITSRLNVLVDNAYRFVRNERLHPRLSGTDEIARLDVVLRNMASTIEEAAARERAIISNAADVICSINQELKFTAVNPASIDVWGYEPDELIGHRLTKFTTEEGVPSILKSSKDLAVSQLASSFESTFKMRDGRIKNMLWSAYWSRSDHTFFCVAHDITERKEAEEVTKQSEARIRLIFESMPVGLIIINEKGFVEKVNARTAEMLGYSQRELVGKHLATLFLNPATSDQEPFIDQLLKKAFGRSAELYARRMSGEPLPVEVSISKLEMGEGPRLLTTVQDVTERREIEKLKQDFVAMVSHDIKTPLTSILSTLGLATANAFGTISERGKTMFHSSEKQVTRLINMLNDLLLVEKIEAGGFELQLDETDLRDVMHESIESVKSAASQRSIKIESHDTDARLHADGVRLVQVLVNLLSNAIKFSSEGSVVTVSVAEQPEWIEVKVTDRGRGIPESHQKMVFEKFRQVKLSDSRDKGGTGLGLPICKLIIDRHGGEIGVDSQEGHGSTFWFRLPKEAKCAGEKLCSAC